MDSDVWACQVKLTTDLGDPRRDQDVINYTELVDILANNSRVRMLSAPPHSWVNGEPWKPNLQATILTIFKVDEIKDGWPYGTDTYGAVAVDVLWGYQWEVAFWEKFANMVNGLPQVKLLRASIPVTVTRLPQLSLLKVPCFKVYYEQPIALLANIMPHKHQCPLLAVNFFRQMISEWLLGEREIDRILFLCTSAKRTEPFNIKELLVLVAGLAEGLPGCFKICASTWLIRRTETSRDGLVISLQPQVFMLCRCDYWERRERTFEDSLQHSQAFAALLEAHQRMKANGLSAEDTRIKKTIFEKDARAYLKAYGALPRRVVLCDFAICASLCFDYDWIWSNEKQEFWSIAFEWFVHSTEPQTFFPTLFLRMTGWLYTVFGIGAIRTFSYPQYSFVLDHDEFFAGDASGIYPLTGLTLQMNACAIGFLLILQGNCVAGFLVVHAFWMLNGHVRISPQTRRLQKKLMTALILQLAIPYLTLLCPWGFYALVQITDWIINPAYLNFAMWCNACHATVSSISVLSFTDPYWKYVISLFGCEKKLSTAVALRLPDPNTAKGLQSRIRLHSRTTNSSV
ncbi:unnamed protein product, partial [Mesorhabditis spiculigera]